MSFDILQNLIQSFWSFIHYNGYVLAFFLMLIEGPIATYVAATVLLWVIEVPNPLLGSLVPAVGFFLSTQSLPTLKRWWIKLHFFGNSPTKEEHGGTH